MNKLLLASVLTGAVFSGFIIGQVTGITHSSAASPVATAVSQVTESHVHGPDAASKYTPHADGTVTAIHGNTLTIAAGTDPAGTTEYSSVTTVLLSSSTQYDAGHDSTAAATKSSIKVGSYLIIDGALRSDGKTINASSVGVHDSGPLPGR